ncbi:MAG: hypothetical protein H0W08_04815 [Acidobacteria bacterium]|nr:hypothetical protein [Acidobacteriota bacterium]
MTSVRATASVALSLVAIELCGREVARRSALDLLLGVRPGLLTLTVVAALAAAAGLMACRRARQGGATAFVFAALFSAGVATQIELGARLQSDGFYYFAYLRSLVFDRDVEFSNDYKLLGLGDKPQLFEPTPTGYAQSAWTIGPAFVWAPFFAAAHPIAGRLAAGGADVSTNGMSYPYRQAVCIAGLVYGLLGCWFTYRLALLFFDARLAGGAVAFTVAGSFMLWYIVKEPSMTHAPSMAGVAGFAWLWAATHGRRTRAQWAILGLVAGFITLIRWQNALFALLPAYEALTQLAPAVGLKDRPRILSALSAGALFTGCAVLAFLPQMLAWKAIYGSFLAVSPIGPQIQWWDPHLVDILWSSRNGLLSWSPVLYLGAVGLAIFAIARPWIGAPAILALALMTYFNASIQDWWGSVGYGGRRFDGTIPLFALGVAAFVDRATELARRHPLRVVAGGGGLLVLWNLTLMSAAQNGHVRIGEAVSFAEAAAHQARAFHGWFGHPFTYPASLLFAARNDVPIGAYDLLSANRFLGDPVRPYGRVDVGEPGDELWLGDGWHAAERAGPVSFRWASQSVTTIIPLDHPASLRVQVRARSFDYPGATAQTLAIVVNGVAQPPIQLVGEWSTALFVVDRTAWRTGVNRLTLNFGRSARPADVGAGSDGRVLAAAIDYLRVEVIQ